MEASSLNEAARKGNEARVKELLSTGDKGVAQLTDRTGHTALHGAAECGHDSIVELLLKAGADINKKDYDGMTPLHLTAADNRFSTAAILIAAGAGVDTTNVGGFDPLQSAAYWGSSEMTELLLAAGANWKRKNKDGFTALEMASLWWRTEIVEIIKKHDRLETVVRPAVVSTLYSTLPVELAELCGDFISMTAERRALEARQK